MNGSINSEILTMRGNEASKLLREEQQKRILDGARRAFIGHGGSVTMADISKASGVSLGLPYHYYANKEQILRKVAEQAVAEGAEGMLSLPKTPGTAGEKLARLVSNLVERRKEDPELFEFVDQVLQSTEAVSNRLRQRLVEQGQAFQKVMRQLVVAGQSSGEVVQGDPDSIVFAVSACLDGITRLAKYNKQELALHFPGAELLLRMILREPEEYTPPV